MINRYNSPHFFDFAHEALGVCVQESYTSRIIAPGLAPGRKAVEFEGFWIDAGNFEEQKKTPDGRFVMTPTVRTRLQDVARAVSYNSSPILLQGPTSAGKTSLVAHLASKAGYRYIRINNHEHTDIQEYMGSYASGEDGRICFKEGLLVQALRRGFWVVLDELNLAPTEVLEALNRLLDDNQELYVPELNNCTLKCVEIAVDSGEVKVAAPETTDL